MFLCCDSKRFNTEFRASEELKLKTTVSYISSFPVLDCSMVCGATWCGSLLMAAALRNALDGLDREERVFLKHSSSKNELIGSCNRQNYLKSFTMHERANFASCFLKQRICKITKREERNTFWVFTYLHRKTEMFLWKKCPKIIPNNIYHLHIEKNLCLMVKLRLKFQHLWSDKCASWWLHSWRLGVKIEEVKCLVPLQEGKEPRNLNFLWSYNSQKCITSQAEMEPRKLNP